jgi:hypothetical protein
MFMRKLGVAAAALILSTSAFASNFRGADQVYVPVAAHAGGSSGLFITDAYIANLSPTDSVDVAVIYVPRGDNAGGTAPAGLEELRGRITLRANERKEFPDILVNTLGKAATSNPFGLLVFNGCKANASCGTDTQDPDGYSPNFRPITVQTRIYQTTAANPNSTTGQLFSGIPWYHFVSSLQDPLDIVFIQGLRATGTAGQAGTFRSNIGIVNASEYSRTEIVFRLYQGTLSQADLKKEAVRTLGPLGNQLYGLTELFGAEFQGPTGTNYFVTVEQRNSTAVPGAPATCDQGCPAFLTYGSVLDNLSGDATTLEGMYLLEMDEEAREILYPTGAGKGGRRMVRH